jgi:2-oxoglutarate ferredoxin oxidoreductase subunit alpha
MVEAIGLAGMTETPVVIVDTQRGGPSTGLPTKQEQSDIFSLIYGTHGEIPKIVIAPSTIEECFYDTIEAFNLSEQFQCPVILVTDLQLSLGKQTSEELDFQKIKINRGSLLQGTLPELEEHALFKRYEFTDSGVSPRVIPGSKFGIHHVTGVEHDEVGRPSENSVNRRKMMDKRLGKLQHVKLSNPIHIQAPYSNPDLLIIDMSSVGGTVDEARTRLEKEGVKTNHITVRLLHPFPVEELTPYISKAKKVVVVENNATGQLANLIKLNVGFSDKIENFLKYDGNPFLPHEIHAKCKQLHKQPVKELV